MAIQYKSLTDLLDQVRDNQVHDRDHYEGLTEAEIYQVRQFYMFDENEENIFLRDNF